MCSSDLAADNLAIAIAEIGAMCRAVAAVVLGSGEKVKFVPLNSQQRFAALQSGEIDILSRNSTWTLTRDASLGIVFAGINYYDGQGFMP